MLHLRKKDKKQDEQVIFIQVAFFAVGAVLLLWYLAPWVLNRILNAGNVLGIAFAVVLLLCGMFAQPVTHLLAPAITPRARWCSRQRWHWCAPWRCSPVVICSLG